MVEISTVPGSSPLARGLPVVFAVDTNERRIIPARAGFTARFAFSSTRLKDHPRSRGVYGIRSLSHYILTGSSPLARGLRMRIVVHVANFRIIPARAGFTSFLRQSGGSRPDHPRSRGVYSFMNGDVVMCAGSSPLARGLPVTGALAHVDRRIIPARAGFTVDIRAHLRVL